VTVRHVRVGDVLRLERTRITPQPAATYRQIGIYSWGKGIIENETISGAELSKVAYYRFPSNALILSNIQAWEAAIAVSTERHAAEFVASQRFLPYVPTREDEVDTRYLLHFLLSDPGMALIRKASPGSVTRNRTLGISAFEDLIVPIPNLSDQQKMASRIARYESAVSSVTLGDVAPAVRVLDQIESEAVLSRIAKGGVMLSALAEVNPRPGRDLPTEVHFVPMADVDEHRGEVIGDRLVDRYDLGAGYKRFLAGDIVFARITPCMQNGKTAIFRGDLAPVGYGSTEFHVLRPLATETTGALHTLLRTRWFRDLAKGRFTGTAGQQRVPAAFLQNVLVPDMSSPEGAELAAQLKDLDAQRRHLLKLQKAKTQVALALPKAARNEVFSKLG